MVAARRGSGEAFETLIQAIKDEFGSPKVRQNRGEVPHEAWYFKILPSGMVRIAPEVRMTAGLKISLLGEMRASKNQGKHGTSSNAKKCGGARMVAQRSAASFPSFRPVLLFTSPRVTDMSTKAIRTIFSLSFHPWMGKAHAVFTRASVNTLGEARVVEGGWRGRSGPNDTSSVGQQRQGGGRGHCVERLLGFDEQNRGDMVSVGLMLSMYCLAWLHISIFSVYGCRHCASLVDI